MRMLIKTTGTVEELISIAHQMNIQRVIGAHNVATHSHSNERAFHRDQLS